MERQNLFNQWAKVRITDAKVKKLIQIAMVPNKEILGNLAEGKLDLLPTHYINIVDNVCEYALGSQTQQMETTAGTMFGAYNRVTGYFKNVRSFKSDEANLNLSWTAQQNKERKPLLIFAVILRYRAVMPSFTINHTKGEQFPLFSK